MSLRRTDTWQLCRSMKNTETLCSKDTCHCTTYKVPNCKQPTEPSGKVTTSPRTLQTLVMITQSSECACPMHKVGWHHATVSTHLLQCTESKGDAPCAEPTLTGLYLQIMGQGIFILSCMLFLRLSIHKKSFIFVTKNVFDKDTHKKKTK